MKKFIIEYGSFIIILMGGFALIYGKNSKYLNFPVFIAFLGIRYLGKTIVNMKWDD